MKEQVYQALEASMLTYQDLADVPVSDNGESLTRLESTDYIVAKQLREEMFPCTGEDVYVRDTVCQLLGQASLRLAEERPGTRLQIGYGYRALEIQTRNFGRQLETLRGTVPDNELEEAAHRRVANPKIAGHPTGGAVDVRMVNTDGSPVDCGTPMWEFVPDMYTFSPFVSRQQRDNRLLLRSAMVSVGFAPFDGEWWHFSYGDKEWAAYYEQPTAVYEQTDSSTINRPKV